LRTIKEELNDLTQKVWDSSQRVVLVLVGLL